MFYLVGREYINNFVVNVFFDDLVSDVHLFETVVVVTKVADVSAWYLDVVVVFNGETITNFDAVEVVAAIVDFIVVDIHRLSVG